MKRQELKRVTTHYCDICGEACGLPFYGYNQTFSYGSCCSSLVGAIEGAPRYNDKDERIIDNRNMEQFIKVMKLDQLEDK